MNLLTDKTPDYLHIEGERLKIKTDFTLWAKFLIVTDEDDPIAIVNILEDIFDEIPTNIEPKTLIKHIEDWLWQCEEKTFNTEQSLNSKQPFDFLADGNIIFCELWEYFPHLMQQGISFPQGLELIKLLISNEKTVLHHRAFARCGDFSKMDKDMKAYWQKERAKYKLKSENNEDALSGVFM
ncbi:MAG: hypothetical protein HFE51_05015 [Clostridia bacterium]|nr:hypothetical protein [Clostridia bacterium]